MICPSRSRLIAVLLKYYCTLVVLVHDGLLYIVSLIIQKITFPHCMWHNVIAANNSVSVELLVLSLCLVDVMIAALKKVMVAMHKYKRPRKICRLD